MKIFTFKIIIFFLFFQTAGAQTIDTIYIDCPGIVGGTWTAEHRYIARCNIFVPYDSVLTIQPGVRIEVQDGYAFKVEGQLFANGTQGDSIEIKSFNENWKGMTFGTPSGEQNMNTSQLSFIKIDCGNNSSSDEAIVIGKHTISSINNLRISNAYKAIKITGFATVEDISHCLFDNVSQGIAFQYCDVVSQVLIDNCVFKNIFERAIIISQNQAYLENIVIEGCEFDNSTLGENNSESALYVTSNIQLVSFSLNSCLFSSFSRGDNSSACIYIYNNVNLGEVHLSENQISLCGGAIATSPNADFGGIYINKSNDVFLEDNVFSNNTGKNSGVGFINTRRVFCNNNSFHDNRNSYTGNENFAGGITFIIGERVEMNEDSFENNVSAKSGGAFIIKSENNDIPIDLLLNSITLASNNASNEGGAVLINATIDTIKVANSVITDNFSSAGSGGCFSLISSAFNDLIIESNTMRDNFVSENSDGGFLSLIHDPSVIPNYENIILHANVNAAAGHNSQRNYSIFYSQIKSFPKTISITDENISDCYPVNGYLYHFELLQSGPQAPGETVILTMTGNEFTNNHCPVLFLANDSCTVTGDFKRNKVTGDEESFGTFITLECKKAPSLTFENEEYSQLISGSSGGAVSVKTVKEIGDVNILTVISEDCFSVEGDGGHFSLISGNSDPSLPQSLDIMDSYFDNSDIIGTTGGNGGAVYLKTPGNIDSILIRLCYFDWIKAEGSGGAVYIDAKSINHVSIAGNELEYIDSHGGDGAICFNAGNGNIKSISILAFEDENNWFSDCSSTMNGGALSAKASGEIGRVLIESLVSYDCTANENGGFFSFVSSGSDAALSQELVISNAYFESQNSEPSGNDGGAIYYSSQSNLDSLHISSATFLSFLTFGYGGALFLESKEIGKINIHGSAFTGASSLNAGGGAMYISADNGNIGKIDNIGGIFLGCHSKLDGGALSIRASGEIGPINMDSVQSEWCFSTEGDGGHFAFTSGNSNPAFNQELIISNSTFNNSDINDVTGGDGGAVYYKTPGNLDSLHIRSCLFTDLKTQENAGALFLNAKEIDKVNLAGSQFSSITSLDTAGAIFINAANGNINKLFITPYNDVTTSFSSCSSKFDGGALCIKASKEIGLVSIDSVEFEKCYSGDGNGGHLSLISLGSDPAVGQSLIITNSSFSNSGISSSTGGNGGILFYSAQSDVATVAITNSEFKNARSVKDGGSIYLNADKILSLNVSSSIFSFSVSEVLSGGALYFKSNNGLLNGIFLSNKFINCTSNLMGGAIFIEDSKYDNDEENIDWSSNTYRKENMTNIPDMGGAVYCKGINAVSFAGDSVISQTSSMKGGFLYLEKVYASKLDGIYTYNNSSREGGVIYHLGDEQSVYNQSSRINNSTFLFNNAELTGGCFNITNIDSVEIGKPDNKNVFVANQSLSLSNNEKVGGGVFYIQNAQSLNVSSNSFYVNKSKNNGGVGILDAVSSSLLIENNSILSNQANAGGAFTFINTFPDGLIANNNFYHNSSAEQGGALLFSPTTSNNFEVRDNTFFENNTGKLGGAIASYRPVSLIRNLYRENFLFGGNPNEDHKGTTIYLSGNGNQTIIKNCVFDQNYYPFDSVVACLYFEVSQSSIPDLSIANSSFFNLSDQHLSVFNANALDTVYIKNSIFTLRDGGSRDESVSYFNESVKCSYCDLIYSEINDPVNHNVDEYIYFNAGDYYFDSTQYPVDHGDPDPFFNDFHFPPAYGTLRNDIGMSGGPDNPDSTGTFLFHEPVDLPTNFDIIVTSSECFDYSFECRGDFVGNYEFFYWFLPDTIIRTTSNKLDYTFNQDTYGNHTITALGNDISNTEAYGIGQYIVNLDIVRINSLKTEFENNSIPIPATPFSFTIEADIYVEDNTDHTWDWNVIDSQGVEFIMQESETTDVITIQKIYDLPSYISAEYKIEACNRIRKDTITIQLQTSDKWGYPVISFYPVNNDIPDVIASLEIVFNKIMTKVGGSLLENNDVDEFITISYPFCPDLTFIKEVQYGTQETTFFLKPVNANTQQPDTLCNGEYIITVKGEELLTQFYQLPGNDTTKTYIVTVNDINDLPDNLMVKVFPNPFREIINIAFNNQDVYLIEITDLTGHVQKMGNYAGISEVTLNLEALSDGMYLLHIINTRIPQHLIMKINKITH